MVVVPAHAIMLVYDISSCIVIHIYGCFMEQMTGYHCEKERTYHETVVVPQRCPATFCAAEVRHSRSGWPWRVLALTQAEQVPREKKLKYICCTGMCAGAKYIYIHILLYYILVYYYVICGLFYSSYLIYSFHPVLSCPASATCSSAGGGGTHRRLRLATRASQRLEPHGACTLW